MKNYYDIRGDGGSRIVEQIAESRRRIQERLASIKHLVAIGSGKGGVGKSALTVQLALSLQNQGYSVAVLDADFNGPSIARMFGVTDSVMLPGPDGLVMPRTADGIRVVSLGTVMPEDEALTFDSFSSGESYVWRATKEFTSLGEILSATVWGELDVLLIDLPPGPERTFHFAEFFAPRLNMVLVTAPSELSMGVVQRSISAVRRVNCNILGYVENMKGYISPETGELLPLFPKNGEPRLGISCLGEVPFEPELARLCDEGLTRAGWRELDCVSYVDDIATSILSQLDEPVMVHNYIRQ